VTNPKSAGPAPASDALRLKGGAAQVSAARTSPWPRNARTLNARDPRSACRHPRGCLHRDDENSVEYLPEHGKVSVGDKEGRR